MFRNYFITAWRNLVKNKLNASINIIGLSVAFICCILLSLTVYFELSYDSFHKNINSLYRAYSVSHKPDEDAFSASFAYPAAPAFKQVQGIAKASRYMSGGNGIRYKNKEVDKNIMLADNDFFSMFTFPVVAGNTIAPLGSTSNVVLSKSTADAVFDKEDPIGKKYPSRWMVNGRMWWYHL